MIELPKTLAALGSPNLANLLLAELGSERLPLESHTTHGGWPEAPSIAIRAVEETSQHVKILITVDFIEQVPAACPASSRAERRTTYLAVVIRRCDAFATIHDDR
jgi:hypothetical protein